MNSTKVTPTTTPTVTHQKTNNEDDFDNISDITMNTRSYANPKPPPTKPKEVTPTTMEPKDAEVEQDNKVSLKEVESNKVFELNEIGHYGRC